MGTQRPAWWKRPAALMLAVGLWLVLLGNQPLWSALQRLELLQGPSGAQLATGLGVAILGAVLALQALLAWPGWLKPASIALLLIGAVGAFYMNAYRVVIDPTMMVNVMQTDVREVRDLLSPTMLLTVGGLGVLPALAVARWPLVWGRWQRRVLGNLGLVLVGLAMIVGGVLGAYQPLSSTMRNHKQLRYLINPLNSLYAAAFVASEPLRRKDTRLRPAGEDARLAALPTGAKPLLLVLVVGETARADNFGLYGYARDTTPALRQHGALHFPEVRSCGTSTAASLPCMFSPLGRIAYEDRDGPHETLLDVLQRAGLAVYWLDNQSGCKGVCDRVPHGHTQDKPDPAVCNGGECLDAALLHDLDARLEALDVERRQRGIVLVLHMMGSHGPAYAKRSPPSLKRFQPECTQPNLQACERQAVVNAYDNSIAYTDQVLGQVIDWLQGRSATHDTAMLYVSDHGESLGENGLYLHGLPYAVAPDVQTRVPWVTWLSSGFQSRQGLPAECVARARAPISHDHLFHSALGLAGVLTRDYDTALDAYAACRGRALVASVPGSSPAVAAAPARASPPAAASAAPR